jgi:Meiotically up-regulated gene 113
LKQRTFDIPEPMLEQLKAVAARLGISQGEAARHALAAWLCAAQARPETVEVPRSTGTRSGFVYLFRSCADPALCKIGRSSNPRRRLKQVQKGVGASLELVHLIPTTDMFRLEHELHERFAAQRLSKTGEWFRLEPAHAELIGAIGADGGAA